MPDPSPIRCRICGSPTVSAGHRQSTFSDHTFELGHCPTCRFSFVVEPRTDFANVYDEAYYAGRGADPHVAYSSGAAGRPSVQRYEWDGIVRILEDSGGLDAATQWLDYGCGLGGLVQFGRAGGYQVWGHDVGYAADELARLGIPALSASDLTTREGQFQIVTAIEVLEHVIDPLEVLGEICRLLRPGGFLLLTTGNARSYRGHIDRWQYVLPDVHVSFFEPDTLRLAYRKVGLVPRDLPFAAGHANLIRSKILRTLRVHTPNVFERSIPWGFVSRLADRRFGVSEQPAAVRPLAPSGRATAVS